MVQYSFPYSDIMKCTCVLLWLSSGASPEFVSRVNKADYEEEFVRMNAEAQAGLARECQRHVGRIKQFKQHGRLLDFGSGTGDLMRVASAEGFDVEGIDSSLAAREFTSEKYGFKVLSSLDLVSDESIDVVSLNNVLEHVPCPSQLLNNLWKKLKPGGFIYIAVPNVNGWASKLLKDSWGGYCPAHLFYYSKQTLMDLLSKHGYSVKKVSANTGKPIGGIVLAALIKHRLLGYPRAFPKAWQSVCPSSTVIEYSKNAHLLAAAARPILSGISIPFTLLSFAFDAHDELAGIFQRV